MITIPTTERYLIMVDTCQNHNKFYKMIPKQDKNSFVVEYGRVGNAGNKMEYPIQKWNAIYTSKIAKGYVDKTELHQNALEIVSGATKKDSTYKEIINKNIREIVEKLQRLAKKNVQENYTITHEIVTEEMLNEAQLLLNQLTVAKTIYNFNELLSKLFEVIPRKMNRVIDHCAKTERDFSRIIDFEQKTLDNMKGQVVQFHKTKKVDNQKTILDALGLKFEELSDEELSVVKEHMDAETRARFKRAWKVINQETEERFNDYCKKNKIKKVKYFYHGSRSENWWSIINTGLKLNPTNAVITGKMFGYGIYFAPKAKKSAGYTSTKNAYWTKGTDNCGYMAVYKIAYGKPYDVYSHSSELSRFTNKELQKACPGANCLHAHAGSMLFNDEVIVYNEDACTIRYLIEFE